MNDKRLWYINDTFRGSNNGGSKAKSDFMMVFKSLNVQEIQCTYFQPRNVITRNITRFLFPISMRRHLDGFSEQDIVFIQWPFYSIKNCEKVLIDHKRKGEYKLITIIHDIESLRNIYKNATKTGGFEKTLFTISDAIICHNEAMKKYIADLGIDQERIIVLGIFDYILKENKNITNCSDAKKIINIAGSMDPLRSSYIYKLLEQNWKLCNLRLYGPKFDKSRVKCDDSAYRGSYSTEEIPFILNEGWGLAWDGDSLDECGGPIGKYLPYCNQHKVSLYIAAGLPVIIPNTAGLASFVKENNIGVTVDRIDNIEDTISTISDNDYEKMIGNVLIVRESLINGKYAERAIGRALAVVE